MAFSLSVHRLVQEVIRDSINNEDKHIILLNAIRMVNFALASTTSPYDGGIYTSEMLHFLSTLILLVPLVHVKFVGNLCHFPLS
jgi:hypothetical protein